ncbi:MULTISPECIES: SAM-dependent methyltransferase [unclassified Streptomyces]|uniref:SAM-dependent methyltransferase n=1 Tax=unclassified Streptomyces TaxID=2593676 RepID=UPI002DDC5AE3|nr:MULTISPECIES: SAM-dependent methyltransferase [unclassified Streptomyces]WSA90879.1 SAM-dependent methyltransferase [Streptomyces sp. NBC_01795]WSB75201.1 SAM-dependent methyltransferase [Streptomyces sp. NBC_01775]WSS16515.1 SAM-dependent methyltransferase [Streptomyces sp. NBC_01186]WSS45332.1 SAM-dependent methyltransferase [Streptomyces sp. NBC_01187]
MSDETVVPEGLGVRPHSARLYDYFLGGKTNYSVDRKLAGESLRAYPNAMVAARHNRAFMHRVVRHLGRDMGMRQFLDIGTGIPTSPNLHQIAQAEHVDARIVYSDNDPIVLAHARALMTGTPEGATDYIEADVREPDLILEHARKTLDFDQPIALSLIALLHFVPDSDSPDAIVERLLEELPSGSALALSHGTADLDPDMQRLADSYVARGLVCRLRPREDVRRYFDGLTMVEPGLVASCDWRPELDDGPQLPGMVESSEVGVWAGLGIKP